MMNEIVFARKFLMDCQNITLAFKKYHLKKLIIRFIPIYLKNTMLILTLYWTLLPHKALQYHKFHLESDKFTIFNTSIN